MSSIRISYGVNSYSIGVREKLIFFSLTPRRSSSTTCIQKRACEKKNKQGKHSVKETQEKGSLASTVYDPLLAAVATAMGLKEENTDSNWVEESAISPYLQKECKRNKLKQVTSNGHKNELKVEPQPFLPPYEHSSQ